MKEQLIALFISLGLIVIGAITSYKYPQYITIKDSIFIGLFSYVVTLVVFLASRTKLIDSLRRIDKNVDYLFNYFLTREKAKEVGSDLFSTFWTLCLLRTAEGVYKFIDPNTFEITKEQLPQFWLQAAINTDVSWYCTNYVNSPDDWESGWASWEFQVQSQCMKQVGTTVRRLFIAREKSEINKSVIKHMKEHDKLGFNVKLVTRDIRPKWAPFDELEQLIGTVDIAIINGRYLFAFILNENEKGIRSLSHLRCHGDQTLVNKVSEVYSRLWESGGTLDDTEQNYPI